MPEQHPLAHEVESHTQLPLWHRCPARHAGPPLQVHTPDAEHPSPLDPHDVQEPPLTPQLAAEADMHTLPEQQPAGHDAALHTQLPLTQSSPVPHAAPAPHVHAPAVQPSALAPQDEHAPPLAPHAPTVGVVHVDPEQHPLGHVVPLQPAQAPALQNWFEGQFAHTAPPEPHMPWALPGSHVDPLQQPPHDVLSHTQVPPRQRCPVEQASPPPHVHAPAEEHPSAVAPHAWHCKPPVPHAGPVGGEVQTFPVQHPWEHEVAVQTHTPLEHACPGLQAALAPHRQAPAGEQLSAVVALQATHALPSIPQLPNSEVWQVLPLQQPVGHDAELQTQCPITHACPAPHASDEPQLHLPDAEQLSAVDGVHWAQATPATPQLPKSDDSQLAPKQQPVAQFAGVQPVHTPATQFWSAGHIEQPEPPAPQNAVVVPGSHRLPLQQPVGHEVLLQTHAPPTHTCPMPHTAPAPHSHVPTAEQPFALAPHLTHPAPPVPHAAAEGVSHTRPLQQPVGQELALHTHAPPTHACPAVQAGPLPQEHVPSLHPSEPVALHAVQLAPLTPHAAFEGVVQVVPWQHPVGHDAASHTHAPPTHSCPAPHGEPVPH